MSEPCHACSDPHCPGGHIPRGRLIEIADAIIEANRDLNAADLCSLATLLTGHAFFAFAHRVATGAGETLETASPDQWQRLEEQYAIGVIQTLPTGIAWARTARNRRGA